MKTQQTIILSCIFLFMIFTSYAFSEPAIQAGTAQVEITPPIGIPMWGYASRTEGAQSVHDPLMAKVLILQSTETTVAIVSWDVCEFQSPWLHDQMQSIGIDHLLLLCSHTHAGPDLAKPFPSADKPWLKTIEERILHTIKQAQQDMFPAYINADEGSITLGYNRLRRDADGLATTIFSNVERVPIGPVDPTVGVIRVTDNQNKIRAVVVHYACHPVVLGSKNLVLSADYVGAMYRKVEEELGNDALCLFAQGGAGDINPLFQGRSESSKENFVVVDKMGGFLAKEVLKTLDQMKTEEGKSTQLRASVKTITTNHRWEPDKTLKFATTALLINNDIGIVTIAGEPFHKFQVDVREKSALPHAYMFGYCDCAHQDWPNWYFPDIESAARGGYGASDSGIAEVGSGERIINQGLIELYTLRGMLHDKPYGGRVSTP